MESVGKYKTMRRNEEIEIMGWTKLIVFCSRTFLIIEVWKTDKPTKHFSLLLSIFPSLETVDKRRNRNQGYLVKTEGLLNG